MTRRHRWNASKIELDVRQPGVGDEQRHLSSAVNDLAGERLGLGAALRRAQRVVACVPALELLQEHVGVVLGHQDDRGIGHVTQPRTVS